MCTPQIFFLHSMECVSKLENNSKFLKYSLKITTKNIKLKLLFHKGTIYQIPWSSVPLKKIFPKSLSWLRYILSALSKYNLKFEKFISSCIFFLFYSGDRRPVPSRLVDLRPGLRSKNRGVAPLTLHDPSNQLLLHEQIVHLLRNQIYHANKTETNILT